jgi:hypothetical protein
MTEKISTRFPTLNPDDVKSCEEVVQQLFDCIAKSHGIDEARRIFEPHGRPLTKREIQLRKDALLLFGYYRECVEAKKSGRKPNVRQLALRLSKIRNTDPVALERKIWRALKDKKLQQWSTFLREHLLEP